MMFKDKDIKMDDQDLYLMMSPSPEQSPKYDSSDSEEDKHKQVFNQILE